MCCMSAYTATIGTDALVRNDRPHAGRFADDAAIGPHATLLEFGNHRGRADAANLLVVRKREMHGLVEPRRERFGQAGQHDTDITLHIATAASEQLAVAYDGLERVGVPLLAVDRHHIGMPRQ